MYTSPSRDNKHKKKQYLCTSGVERYREKRQKYKVWNGSN